MFKENFSNKTGHSTLTWVITWVLKSLGINNNLGNNLVFFSCGDQIFNLMIKIEPKNKLIPIVRSLRKLAFNNRLINLKLMKKTEYAEKNILMIIVLVSLCHIKSKSMKIRYNSRI